jgi:spermidine/putrescine transport system substrate-binding protein
MSDDLDRAIRSAGRSLVERNWSRRRFMRSAVAAGSLLSVPAILAACGISAQSPTPGAAGTPGTSSVPGTPGASGTPAPATPVPSPAGQIDFANWPLYIDIDEDTGAYPTLEKFKSETGISYTYTEDINDNEEFFGKIQPDLAAGRSTGYDLIVLTDWMIERMIRLGYLMALDHNQLPDFEANAQDLYRDPWYDPGNRYSVAWQSGITGIGYNKKLTKRLLERAGKPNRPITKFDDLLDPAFAGRVGMFSEMRDTVSLTLLSIGVKPADATIDDVNRAMDKLKQAGSSQFRAFYGNDYYDALAGGGVAITIAWSGDVSQMKLYDNADVEFVVPDTGGMLWVDNMCIPNAAKHPVDAHVMANFWYQLDNAVALTEYIGYFSPVKGVAEQVKADADEARANGDTETADALDVVSQTAFPDNATLQNVNTYKVLDESEERAWNDAFNQVVF